MFRRSGKSPFEDVQTLYEEDTPSHANYSYSRTERLDSPPNLFDTPKSVETRPLSSYPVNEEPQKWSAPSEIDSHFLMSEEPETTLGEGVTFKGELAFERLLRIDGTFEGILVSQGKIIIGPKGYVKADIQLQDAIIEGIVEGNISVTGKIELRGEAIVKGDIQATTLCVDEGVRLLGHVSISGLPEDLQKD
ncbi:bactofilin family protein [Chlamydia avium]|uniref:Polymer-forming cytoskeletal family protein n=1 Tax=Chlamydia avium TaxID=1457141 RepID=A0ABN0MRF4_9CHLA|nr:polymer-forming cytoskeletal protein [Chlamydia avium]EPP35994.1 polymer-forming cytoskeletal family protein [Chlamydia psittaci 10_743_SC13]EPP38059.1 polymer-forming cytoskeletal family protein [Chlamydia avium]